MVAHQQPPTMDLKTWFLRQIIKHFHFFSFLHAWHPHIVPHAIYIHETFPNFPDITVLDTIRDICISYYNIIIYNRQLLNSIMVKNMFLFSFKFQKLTSLDFSGVQVYCICFRKYSIGNLCTAQHVWNAVQVSNKHKFDMYCFNFKFWIPCWWLMVLLDIIYKLFKW